METILAAFIIACSNLARPTAISEDTTNKMRSECIQRVVTCVVDRYGEGDRWKDAKMCSKEVHL